MTCYTSRMHPFIKLFIIYFAQISKFWFQLNQALCLESIFSWMINLLEQDEEIANLIYKVLRLRPTSQIVSSAKVKWALFSQEVIAMKVDKRYIPWFIFKYNLLARRSWRYSSRMQIKHSCTKYAPVTCKTTCSKINTFYKRKNLVAQNVSKE